jgi:hypothetical protein
MSPIYIKILNRNDVDFILKGKKDINCSLVEQKQSTKKQTTININLNIDVHVFLFYSSPRNENLNLLL